MIHRFDHCVIAVQALSAAIERYTDSLGLTAQHGGQHTGLGTENAIVRFGLDYIELLAVYDERLVRQAGPRRSALLDYLAERPGGMLGFCLAAQDLDGLAERFAETGLDAVGPFDMRRERPDGSILSWRLLVPGGLSWRKPWPFFIEWELPDDKRLRLEQPGAHALGNTAVAGVSLVVNNLDTADHLYGEQLGLDHEGRSQDPVYGVPMSVFRVAKEKIYLLAPQADGQVAEYLGSEGEGLFECHLEVPELDFVRTKFAELQVPYIEQPGPSLLVDPGFLWGARLRWIEAT